MKMMTGLAAILIACSFATAAWAKTTVPTLRDQEQAACFDDANRLCKDAIPDEDKISACMKEKFSQVSAGCKKFFK